MTTRVSRYLYPKITYWNYNKDKIAYATIPANTGQKVRQLLEFVDSSSEFSTQFSEVNLVDNIFPSDHIIFFDKHNKATLILPILELEDIYERRHSD